MMKWYCYACGTPPCVFVVPNCERSDPPTVCPWLNVPGETVLEVKWIPEDEVDE